MNEDLISRSALSEELQTHHDFFVNGWGGFSNLPTKDKVRVDEITNCIAEVMNAPAVDAVSKEEYEHLLKIATKMHTWIFLNTFDELAVYDELGLTDDDNSLLGYGGQFVIEEKED